MEKYDYIIVGAGPAGLAFASSVNHSNLLVIDCGKEVNRRERFNAQECIQGAGGAGLFSDGKFSFYPAGTEIWNQDEPKLREAYEMLRKDLSPFGSIPEFPRLHQEIQTLVDSSGWTLKPYRSIYLSLNHRIKLIETLAERCPEIRYQTEFIGEKRVVDGYLIKLHNLSSGAIYYAQTDNLILAGGRFMPLFLNGPKRFRRYEFGFRVQGPSHLIQKGVQLIDPKYVFGTAEAEYRTFCWCENGEVIKTSFQDIVTFSGRADCAPTSINNFGFNIRIKNPAQISEVDFKKLIHMAPYEMGIVQFVKKLPALFGPTVAPLVEQGCSKLCEKFPDLFCEDVKVLGPAIEGIGFYPDYDKDNNIYVIGDCSGIYRGIVPSMIAGYYLAATENQSVEHKENLQLLETK